MLKKEVWTKEKGTLIRLLKKADYRDALELVERSFYTDESVSKAVKLVENEGGRKDLNQMCLQVFEDGVSLLAIDESTGKIAGAAFNKIQSKANPGESFFEVFMERECKDPSAKALMDFMIQVDSRSDIFGKYGVDKTLEVMFIMVDKEFRGRGIGVMLTEASFDVARELGITVVNAIFTSQYSQKIATALRMDVLAEASHDDFIFDGEPFTTRTSPHKSSILVAKKIV